MNHNKWVVEDAIELCEVFLKHHTGQHILSDLEIFKACYNAGRVTGRHTNPRSSVYERGEKSVRVPVKKDDVKPETNEGNSARSLVGKLVEMGDLRDSNGDLVRGVLIECSMEDLRNCDLRMYGQVSVSNATDHGQRPVDPVVEGGGE